MADITPHVRTSDLPSWPSPPRVRDIPGSEDSWGWVWLSSGMGVVQDELGRLWADGNGTPKVFLEGMGGRACLAWTEQGLGVYIAPEHYDSLLSQSSLDMDSDRWIPLRAVLRELPARVKQFVQES